MTRLFSLSAIADVYADAYLADDSGNLIFLSVWGRDTALQELLARLQLPRSENGIRDFNLVGEDGKKLVSVPNIDELEKVTTKTGQTILGDLTQLWIYDKLASRPDIVNHRGLMLHNPDHGLTDPWPLLKSVCPLPLLDTWKDIMLAKCRQKKWIQSLNNGVGITGTLIEFDDDLEAMMTQMIRQGELALPATNI